MNVVNKNALINLYVQKYQNFKNILKPKNITLKKSFLKSKTNFVSSPINNISLIHDLDEKEKSSENSKVFLSNNESLKPLFLPSISNLTTQNKTIMNSSLVNNINSNNTNYSGMILPKKKKFLVKLKKIKIKKSYNREIKTPIYMDKKLIDLYNEDLFLKKKFEDYKHKKILNMKNFSYQKYNLNLLKLSSINLSQNSYNSFKKNMDTIENNMNGQKLKKKNRWMVFLEKIGSFAPEGLKKKIKSFSEHKKPEENEKS